MSVLDDDNNGVNDNDAAKDAGAAAKTTPHCTLWSSELYGSSKASNNKEPSNSNNKKQVSLSTAASDHPQCVSAMRPGVNSLTNSTNFLG